MAKKKVKKTFVEKVKGFIDEVDNTYPPADLEGKVNSLLMNNTLDKHVFGKHRLDLEKINNILSQYKEQNENNMNYDKCRTPINSFLDKIQFLRNQSDIENDKPTVGDVIKETEKWDNPHKDTDENSRRNPNPHRHQTQQGSNTSSTPIVDILSKGIERSKKDILSALSPLKSIQKVEPIINKGFKDVKSEIVKNATELSDKGISLQLKVEERIKTIEEGIETIEPNIRKMSKKIDELSEKVDSSASSTAQKLSTLPKDEKSIVELAGFMKDGLTELENIARYYIQNQSKIERSDTDSKDAEEEKTNFGNKRYEEGTKEATLELARKIFELKPAEFEEISFIFDDYKEEKYSLKENITVTLENRQELELEIEGITEEGIYTISSPALFLNGEVLRKAKAQKNEVEG